ncbi:GNAT family N-acetyltransferase [Modestobacter sp. I12A-02662]|uniref:GNAT family N-acetyltransferase n=1 Tax=Modestobacter sp. I12A-02662 TaxID=1730496 RepID=UPI0034E0563E
MSDLVVRPAVRGDLRPARDAAVAALRDDPAWTHVLPDAGERRTALRALVGFSLADAGCSARVAVAGTVVLGAAVWQPPGRYPVSTVRRLRGLPHLLPMTVGLGRRTRDVQRLGSAIDAAFPSRPVRYLQVLGVAPAAQGRGIGSLLLDEQLSRSDAAGEPVYLETGKPTNVGWYAARGFEPVAPGGALHPGGPPMWRMLREPAGGTPTRS